MNLLGEDGFVCTSVYILRRIFPNQLRKETAMDIQGFFQKRSVLVTGGTGFLGKVLVEKLLRSCPGLDKIYLLIRSTDKSSARQRLLDLQSKSDVFLRVRSECPGALSKLVALDGDVTLPGLGLSDQDTQEVIQNVSVVFHVAATVRFNETLRLAALVNFEGTINITSLAKKMDNLKAFVHVSTAYSNCNRDFVAEVVYPSTLACQDFMDILKNYGEDELMRMTPDLLKGHPNTYTFTKQMAENYLVDFCKELPVVITRPAIVTAAWKEPFPGWIDNKVGVTGLVILLGNGILQTLRAILDGPAEIWPVDTAVNQMIAGAWDVANRDITSDTSKLPVLNGVSSPVNPLPRRSFYDILIQNFRKYPMDQVYLYPACTTVSNKTIYDILFTLRQSIPAWILDFYLMAKGEKCFAVDLTRKLYYNIVETYSMVLIGKTNFSCQNVLKLQGKMHQKDRQEFNLSLKTMDWTEYLENYVLGIKHWTLQTSDQDLPEMRRKMNNLYYKTQLFNASVIAILATFVWRSGIFNMLSSFLF